MFGLLCWFLWLWDSLHGFVGFVCLGLLLGIFFDLLAFCVLCVLVTLDSVGFVCFCLLLWLFLALVAWCVFLCLWLCLLL